MSTEVYEALRAQGFRLAGGLGDLRQRACVYHHMYADSGKRNVFPLIAAHGALWAAGYFRKGLLGGQLVSLLHAYDCERRQALLASLHVFANQFRDINRRVCAESYAIYHYTKIHGRSDAARSIVDDDFLDLLCASHESQANARAFPRAQRARLFSAFFNWEQDNIVAPSVIAAYEEFDWPLIKKLALRPKVAFSYFGRGHSLQFENFSSKQERIVRGFQAYERAEEVGLARVEQALLAYSVMPEDFLATHGRYFDAISTSAI
jgi:hypothetical protein